MDENRGHPEPIDTAPKDGSWIIGICDNGSIQKDNGPKPFVFTTRWVREVQTREVFVSQRGNRTIYETVEDESGSHWEGYENPTRWLPLNAFARPQPIRGSHD